MAVQQAMNNQGQLDMVQCTAYGTSAVDAMGQLECLDGGCCMCSEILCGYGLTPCEQAQFGDFSAAGVQNIRVRGSAVLTPGQQGAQISCNGMSSLLIPYPYTNHK